MQEMRKRKVRMINSSTELLIWNLFQLWNLKLWLHVLKEGLNRHLSYWFRSEASCCWTLLAVRNARRSKHALFMPYSYYFLSRFLPTMWIVTRRRNRRFFCFYWKKTCRNYEWALLLKYRWLLILHVLCITVFLHVEWKSGCTLFEGCVISLCGHYVPLLRPPDGCLDVINPKCSTCQL